MHNLLFICKTCEYNFKSVCANEGLYKDEERISSEDIKCDNWRPSFEYISKIVENAPWYIKEPYKGLRINYNRFLELLRLDAAGVGIEINIYDAIEKVYDLNHWELAGVLDVSSSIISYAKAKGTIAKRKEQFAMRLNIPIEFFKRFMSTQLDVLEKCKEEFWEFYGNETIEKLKQSGINALNAKIERDIVDSKIEMEKYRAKNQYKYQYMGCGKMYHDLSEDYKSRDYVIAITLKEGEYSGNLFYEYNYNYYGLSVMIMKDILSFIENLNCIEIDDLNKEGLLNNNIGLRADINSKELQFELINKTGDILKKVIPENDLQKYIVGYEMIRCDGHGKKKERKKCSSCENFKQLDGCTRGQCLARGDIIQRSRIICAFDYVSKEK